MLVYIFDRLRYVSALHRSDNRVADSRVRISGTQEVKSSVRCLARIIVTVRSGKVRVWCCCNADITQTIYGTEGTYLAAIEDEMTAWSSVG
jgi:hypothetical protein